MATHSAAVSTELSRAGSATLASSRRGRYDDCVEIVAHAASRVAQRVLLSNHFFALGRRCGQPGQQQGRRLPARSSSTTRWIRRMRVASCFAEMTQQTHSFRASGVRPFQAACVVASEASASDKSAGILCTLPAVTLSR